MKTAQEIYIESFKNIKIDEDLSRFDKSQIKNAAIISINSARKELIDECIYKQQRIEELERRLQKLEQKKSLTEIMDEDAADGIYNINCTCEKCTGIKSESYYKNE